MKYLEDKNLLFLITFQARLVSFPVSFSSEKSMAPLRWIEKMQV